MLSFAAANADEDAIADIIAVKKEKRSRPAGRKRKAVDGDDHDNKRPGITPETVYGVDICPRENLPYNRNYPINNTSILLTKILCKYKCFRDV